MSDRDWEAFKRDASEWGAGASEWAACVCGERRKGPLALTWASGHAGPSHSIWCGGRVT